MVDDDMSDKQDSERSKDMFVYYVVLTTVKKYTDEDGHDYCEIEPYCTFTDKDKAIECAQHLRSLKNGSVFVNKVTKEQIDF